ncbi:MAG: hypothetical protein M3160_00205 [Candidatus Eremiobacteraeota bacterium]|nr:hypothetical protein [Candidatus Eremiobacteraeota bacterium]
MSAEWVTAIATAGTFAVIAASAIAALLQIRHLRSSNQIAALNECRETIESPQFQDAERFIALELPQRLLNADVQIAMLGTFFPDEYQPMRLVANFLRISVFSSKTVSSTAQSPAICGTRSCYATGAPLLLWWRTGEPLLALMPSGKTSSTSQ